MKRRVQVFKRSRNVEACNTLGSTWDEMYPKVLDYEADFHCFGFHTEQEDDMTFNHPCAIVEVEDGTVRIAAIDMIKLVKWSDDKSEKYPSYGPFWKA